MSADGLGSPDFYPLTLDFPRRRALILRLDEAGYRAASFLDERLLATASPGAWTDLAEVERATASLPESADYIFHIGHVGSTLLSRLLGRSSRVFSVREPALLRGLADAAVDTSPPVLDHRLALAGRLLSRVYRPAQKSLVKATSFVGELATALLTRPSAPRALLLTVSPVVYIASILGGSTSRQALPGLAERRLRRLHRRLGAARWRLEDMDEGERAAMSWVCETLGLTDAAERCGPQVAWIDFERFLDAPEAGLAGALRHLHGEADPEEVADMLASSDLRLYAKAPEHAFDAATRRAILARAASEHRDSIEKGIAWLKGAMARESVIDAGVRRAAEARAEI